MSYSDFKKQAAVRRNAVGILVAGNMKKEAAFGAAGAQLSNSVKALLNALKQSYTSAKATQRPVSWFTRWLGQDLGKYGPAILKNPLVAGTGLGAVAGGLGFAAGKATNKKTAAAAFGAIPAIGNALSPAPAPATVAKPQQAATAQNQQQQVQNQSGEQAPQADMNTIADLTASLNKITDVAKNSIKPSDQNTVAQGGGETAQAEAVSGALKVASMYKAGGLELLLALLGAGIIPGAVGAGIGAASNKRKGLSTREGAIKGFGTGAGMGIGGATGGVAGAYTHPVAALLGLVGGGYGGAVAGNRLAGKMIESSKKK